MTPSLLPEAPPAAPCAILCRMNSYPLMKAIRSLKEAAEQYGVQLHELHLPPRLRVSLLREVYDSLPDKKKTSLGELLSHGLTLYGIKFPENVYS